MPESERQLGPDQLGAPLREAEQGGADVTASWQCGSTLYTLIRHRESAHLYAVRSSGSLTALALDAPTDRAEAAWRMLTCAQAPQEPLAQLALEDLVAAALAQRGALDELDAMERARYRDGRAFVDFARASGVLPEAEAERLARDAEPDPVLLDAVEREMAGHADDLLARWAHGPWFGLLSARMTRLAQPRPDRGGLEQWWDPPPEPSGGRDGGAHACSARCEDLDWRGERPHAHRGTAELHAQLAAAERSAVRAAGRLAAVRVLEARALRHEALHEDGPASARLRARAAHLAQAAAAMAAAVRVQRGRNRDLGRRREHLAYARELARRTGRPAWWWWPRLSSARAGRAACRARRRVRPGEAGTACERSECAAGRVRALMAGARARAPWSADPLGDWERLLKDLPRLREEAVAADLLAVAGRVRRLEREARAWQSLTAWSWWWWHGVDHELAIRHHSGTGPAVAPPPVDLPLQDAVLDLYRRIEFRPGAGA
ncbi:hypothetical protein ABTY61_22660 [Kitasatospora sp. NPDC096128]|uniref:hypothetical protein n=1 Tax=Kitasatospora sp. NPDC096128 TaxID=3155547 RepID=UPI003318BFD2